MRAHAFTAVPLALSVGATLILMAWWAALEPPRWEDLGPAPAPDMTPWATVPPALPAGTEAALPFLVTVVDDATGEQVEVSQWLTYRQLAQRVRITTAEWDGWVAKVAAARAAPHDPANVPCVGLTLLKSQWRDRL